MEFLFSLVALALAIYALIKVGKIESRLDGLLGKRPVTRPLGAEASLQPILEEKTPPELKEAESSGPSRLEKFFAWYSHEWMLKTGAVLILLGIIWFVAYAFLNNWIGRDGRITLGLLAGALILFGGERRLVKIRTQGITLVWLGSSVMTVTIYSAQMIYNNMFPPAVALLLLAAMMIATTFVSLRHNSLSLSLASLLIGGLTPILIGSTEKSIFGLFSYLTVITIGTIWVARYSKWQILTFLALVITAVYSMEFFLSTAISLSSSLTPVEFLQLRFFAITLTSIFFLLSLMTILTNRKVTTVDLITAGAIGLYTYGWINGLVSAEYKGLITSTAAVFYSLASFMTFTRTSLKQPVYLYTAIAVILLAIATAFEFEGSALITAFSIQALILPIIGVRLLGADIGKFILFYFIIPLGLSINAIVSYEWSLDFLHGSSFTITIVTISLLISGLYFYYNKKLQDRNLHNGSVALIVIGGVYALIWIWRTFHAGITPEYLARMATLVVYTGIGITAYIVSEIQKRSVLHKFGLFTVIFVLARLLIFEVWGMELSGKIITFLIVGALLAGSVLLRKQPVKQL